MINSAYTLTSFIKRLLLLSFIALFATQVYADITISQAAPVASAVVPVSVEEIVLRFNASDTSEETNNKVDTITLISAKAGDGTFGFDTAGAYSSVVIYEDSNGNGNYDEGTDTQVGEEDTFQFTSTTIDISGQSISSDNATEGVFYFVAVTVGSDMVGKTTTITLDEVNATNGSDANPNEQANFSVSGILVTTDDDLSKQIVPDYVFPGQTVAMFYFLAEAVGEDVDDASVIIVNDEENFDPDIGVEEVLMYYSSASNKDNNVTFNSSDQSDDVYSYELQSVETDGDSKGIVTLSNWSNQTQNPTTYDMDEDYENGFWIVYKMSDTLSVTNNSTIVAQLESISGTGIDSGKTVSTPSQNYKVETQVAGVTVESVTDITSDDIFGPNSYAPMLSFKLRSYIATSNVDEINIFNPGNVGYAVDGSESGVVKVELYQDVDKSGTFSISKDTLVGSVEMGEGNNDTDSVSVTTDIDLDIYDEEASNQSNNEETIFLIYYLGAFEDTEESSGNIVMAEIGKVSATAQYSFFSTRITHDFDSASSSNDSRLPSAGPVELSMIDTTLSVVSVNSVIPDTIYEGEQDVPMLKMDFESQNKLTSVSFEFRNEAGTFSGDADGVSKISLYRDDGDDVFEYDEDILLNSRSTFSDSTLATLNNIEILKQSNTLFLCYSFGQESYTQVTLEGDSVRAQLYSMSSGSSSEVSGYFPFPVSAVSATPSEKLVDSIELSGTTASDIDADVTFNIELDITNDSNASNDSILVSSLKPKVYKNAKSGIDITHEFSIITKTAMLSDPILKNASAGNTFDVRHATAYSEGTAFVDARLEYTVGDSNPIVFERYFSLNDWEAAVGDAVRSFDIFRDLISDDILGAHIDDPIQIVRGDDNYFDFVNGSAVLEGDIMQITFLTPDAIDESTISLVRNSLTFSRSSSISLNSTDYTYVDGVLKFYVGEEDADVYLDVKDTNGNDYDQAHISYLVSDDRELTNPLFYPNPYVMGGGALKLGFSITQPSYLDIYIYNYIGSLVYSSTDNYFSTVGFNSFEILGTEQFLVPGMYVCFIKARDEDGNNVSRASTKLAIY